MREGWEEMSGEGSGFMSIDLQMLLPHRFDRMFNSGFERGKGQKKLVWVTMTS